MSLLELIENLEEQLRRLRNEHAYTPEDAKRISAEIEKIEAELEEAEQELDNL